MISEKPDGWKKVKVGIDTFGDVSVIPTLLPEKSKISCKLVTFLTDLTKPRKRVSPQEDYLRMRLFGLDYRIRQLESRLKRMGGYHG